MQSLASAVHTMRNYRDLLNFPGRMRDRQENCMRKHDMRKENLLARQQRNVCVSVENSI